MAAGLAALVRPCSCPASDRLAGGPLASGWRPRCRSWRDDGRPSSDPLDPHQSRRLSINKQSHPTQPRRQRTQVISSTNDGELRTLAKFNYDVAIDPMKASLNFAHVLGKKTN